jgi:acyl-coenzyme A synthetase/AMP-(fatty) acid ligase
MARTDSAADLKVPKRGTEARSLRRWIDAAPERFLWDRGGQARIDLLAGGTSLSSRLTELAGRSVLVATGSQLTSALALIELDGVARRIVILPPDADAGHLGALIARAEIDAVVLDDRSPHARAIDVPIRVVCTPEIVPADALPKAALPTEWVLLTSGTTGIPKMVVHDLAGLTAPIGAGRRSDGPVVWGTFYDMRRYGGMQIFLRAAVGGTSFVLSNAGEPIADHLERLAEHQVTHLSGTPSHWRSALMRSEIRKISPRYVRLSGEIADQTILDNLRAVFPQAAVGHAFASTEAGVAFDVNDGREGFPVAYVEEVRDGVEMKVVDGSLRIRSLRTASRYVGSEQASLADPDGFVDTGDMVERRDDRYVFTGRRGGIINVGGLKVHPEEIEAVINRHPLVRMSLVRAKKSPITGSIVVADVVLRDMVLKSERRESGADAALKDEIFALCRSALPRYKVPAAISIVPALDVGASGKLERRQG